MSKTFLRNRQCSSYALRRVACDTVKSALRACNGLHTSTTLSIYPVTRKTAELRCFFNLKRLPNRRCVVLESSCQSGSNPLCYKSGKSGMDHYNSFSVVISFLVMPLGGHLPASLALSKPRRIQNGPIFNFQVT